MKRFSEQFKKKAETLKLTSSEKEVLFARISSYVEYHPLPVTIKKTTSRRGIASIREPFIEWVIPSRFYRQAIVASCLCFVIGIPMLAERAVPGDILYPMKVRVNEEVRGSLTSSGYDKVVWETKRLERRIAEARLLAKEGKLTPEVEAGVIAAVNEHKEATTAEIEVLRTTDADAAALAELTVVSVLDVQSESLKADGSASTTAGMSTVALASALDAAGEQVAQTAHDVSYERLVAQLEQETTRGRELLASIKNTATEQEYYDIERRLSDVERKIESGISLYNTDVDAGRDALKQTWRDMQVIITFMTDIDVRSALAIDTLVPVVLTPEEEKILAIEAYTEAANALVRIEEVLPTVVDGGIQDKVSLSVPDIKKLLETASSSIDSDVILAKASAFEAREYTRSIMAMNDFNIPSTDTSVMLSTEQSTSTATTTTNVSTTTDITEDDDKVEGGVPTE